MMNESDGMPLFNTYEVEVNGVVEAPDEETFSSRMTTIMDDLMNYIFSIQQQEQVITFVKQHQRTITACVTTISILFLWIYVFNHGLCVANRESTVDPQNHTVYYSCQVIWWRWNQCDGKDTVFSEKSKKCEPPEAPTCIDGDQISDPSDITKYEVCHNNQWVWMDCDQGKKYDGPTKSCIPFTHQCKIGFIRQHKGNVIEVCEDGEKFVWKPCQPSGTIFKDGECREPICVVGKKLAVLDEHHRKYRVCVDDGFQWSFEECEIGKIFDESQEKCV